MAGLYLSHEAPLLLVLGLLTGQGPPQLVHCVGAGCRQGKMGQLYGLTIKGGVWMDGWDG